MAGRCQDLHVDDVLCFLAAGWIQWFPDVLSKRFIQHPAGIIPRNKNAGGCRSALSCPLFQISWILGLEMGTCLRSAWHKPLSIINSSVPTKVKGVIALPLGAIFC